MNPAEFLKEAIRMCESYTGCTGCVLEHENVAIPCNCLTTSMETEAPDKLVAIIEKRQKLVLRRQLSCKNKLGRL